jgi:adenylate cyclase
LERKLTAILCADVHGYSRLMGADEETTHRTLTSHHKVIDGLIEQHHGRFVNSAGDSVLAEFASVVNAVQCAVETQGTLKVEDANLPRERRMEFRIGISLIALSRGRPLLASNYLQLRYRVAVLILLIAKNNEMDAH